METTLETIKLAYELSRPIERLGLSTMPYNALKRSGIESIADIYYRHLFEDCRRSRGLEKIRNLGPKGLTEIDDRLKVQGLPSIFVLEELTS